MQHKIKFQFVVILYISLMISSAETTEEIGNNESCSLARKKEDECGFHTYKVVKPLLDYFHEIQNKLKNYDSLIESKNSQILKFEAQNELDSAKLLKYEGQLANNADLIRTKDTIIADQKTELQMKAIILNETQVELEETKKAKLEGHVDSCKPFATLPGIHQIKVSDMDPFDVLCQSAAKGPGWIVIQQRINGREDFHRNWTTYQNGFGSLNEDFFLGLEKIHRLTRNRRHELYIHLERFNGSITYAYYENFVIAGEHDQYGLVNVNGFSGNTTESYDCLKWHEGNRFYTFDRDNLYGCANKFYGGWWYANCGDSNLNGKYFDHEVQNCSSVLWYNCNSLKKVQMLIRPLFD